MGRTKWEYCTVIVETSAQAVTPAVIGVSDNHTSLTDVVVQEPLDKWLDYLDGNGWVLLGKVTSSTQRHLVFRRPK